MDLILDTHALLWVVTGDAKLGKQLITEFANPRTQVYVSAVTAWEYSDLHLRKRLPGSVPFRKVQERLGFDVLDLPSRLWQEAESLPPIHGDPIDRMLVAHARTLSMVVATADKQIREYPVRTLW